MPDDAPADVDELNERSPHSFELKLDADGARADDQDISVSVSTVFHPTANICGDTPPDLIFVTTDPVFFYVHSWVILQTSTNRLGSMVPSVYVPVEGQPQVVSTKWTSDTFNLVLHAVYGMSCTQFSPSMDDLNTVIAALSSLGLQVDIHVSPGSPLFEAAMSHAPLVPLQVYALAAQHDLHPLASAASSHLLSTPLSAITDDLASRIGSVYLKRLADLHFRRMNKLKQLFLMVPQPHAPTDTCSGSEMNRAWSVSVAPMGWEVRPDLSTAMIEAAFIKGETYVASCPLCLGQYRSHVKSITSRWLSEQVTISCAPSPFLGTRE